MSSFTLADVDAMEAFGAALARVCQPPCMIALSGPLGAGKTTLTRGFLHGLGYAGAVKSPTYTLVEVYDHLQFPVYHFDLYRLNSPEELEFMGIRDYLSRDAVQLIEWPERAAGFLEHIDLEVTLQYSDNGRTAGIAAFTENGSAILSRFTFLRLH